MKRLLLPLTIAALTGLFSPLAAPKAHACQCVVGDEEYFARSLLDYSSVVVVGTIADTESRYTQLDVEAVYKGDLTTRIALDQTRQEVEFRRQELSRFGYAGTLVDPESDCTVRLLGLPGQRYLLGLEESERVDEAYSDSMCAVRAEGPSPDQMSWHEVLSHLENLSGGGLRPGGLPTTGGMPSDSSFASLPVALVAALGPLAFLSGAAFLWRRGEPRSG